MSILRYQGLSRETAGEITRRELLFFNIYRCLEAGVYVSLFLTPLGSDSIRITHPLLGQSASLLYLAAALILLLLTGQLLRHLTGTIVFSLGIDIVAAVAVLFSLAGYGLVPMMLMLNIGIAALLMPRHAHAFAIAAALGVATPYVYGLFGGAHEPVSGFVVLAMSGAYLVIATLLRHLGGHVRAAEDLAERRGADLLNLEQINDLIIQRMRTGVMLVDRANYILRINESAWHLIGNPSPGEHELGVVAPELSRRLYHWRHNSRAEQTGVALAADMPEVIPRFTRLTPDDDSNVLIFLEDTSLVSQRAEELTLSSLGRLSASIAHEIRNPLAAIRYSAQLLAESPDLSADDTRLVEIINNHCTRANDVVENILQLSRRERSRPETIDLNAWVLNFVEEYKQSNDLGQDELRAVTSNRRLEVVVDPQHLQQVAWNLVQNALRYGRQPNQPARVAVVARVAADKGPPLMEVIDRGPGIPPKVAAQIFEPFYTTHEYGTGLGLYLAKQMSEASQATLEYVPIAGGGACFRITLQAVQATLSNPRISA